MHELLVWIEGSPLGNLIRSSGVWAYGVINLTHIIGIASLFGAVLVLDLRLLGVRRHVPLGAIADSAVPVAAVGLGIAALSGICLLATNATEYENNPFLLVKFAAIAVALTNVAVIGRLPAWKARGTRPFTSREQRQMAIAGGVSLVSWLVAIGAGRLIGYW